MVRYRFFLSAVVLSIVLTACTDTIDYGATRQVMSMITPTMTDTPQPTRTPTRTSTATPTKTFTITPSQTNSATPTITETPTQTLTPTWAPDPYMLWPRAYFTEADIWYGGDVWCPLRGSGVTCEIEYRDYSGECLVSMSCYDACGKYYGVDTIKNNTGPWTPSGPCY